MSEHSVTDQLALDVSTEAEHPAGPFRSLDPAEADGTACMACDEPAEWRVYEPRRWRDLCERCLAGWLRAHARPLPYGVLPL